MERLELLIHGQQVLAVNLVSAAHGVLVAVTTIQAYQQLALWQHQQ